MKLLLVTGMLSIFISFNAYACEDAHTTQAIVNYVCDYSLVSDTQCNIWKEDMRQMNYNNQIIVDSFLGWKKELEEQQNAAVDHFAVN